MYSHASEGTVLPSSLLAPVMPTSPQSASTLKMNSCRSLGADAKSTKTTSPDVDGRKEAILRDAFAVYDTDQSGYIDTEELRQLLRDLRWPSDTRTICSVLARLDDDLSGSVSIDEFLKWQTMAYEVRVLSPTYGNTLWSAAACEPQLSPTSFSDVDERKIEFSLISAKLKSLRQVAETNVEGPSFTLTSPQKTSPRSSLNRNGPLFAQNPTGSLLEPIDEVEECKSEEDITVQSEGGQGSHWVNDGANTVQSEGRAGSHWAHRKPKAPRKGTASARMSPDETVVLKVNHTS